MEGLKMKNRETVTVCAECSEETREIYSGDEGLTYCENCQQLEPETKELSLDEYDKLYE